MAGYRIKAKNKAAPMAQNEKVRTGIMARFGRGRAVDVEEAADAMRRLETRRDPITAVVARANGAKRMDGEIRRTCWGL